jgi:nitronate monooxygenase
MAGGFNTPEQVAIVSSMGGLGSFGFAYSTPEKISTDIKAARALTKGPIGVNFFIFQPVELPSAEICNAALFSLRTVDPSFKEFKIPMPPFYPDLEKQLESVWRAKPEVLSFHFGIPPESVIRRAHELDICIGISATNLHEAYLAEKAGADFIVAQGIEAGGHRGVFDPDQKDEALSVFDLTCLLKENLKIPIVAAGGIMNGAHVRASINAGAVAAQMGTAFLTCKESGTSPEHKDYILNQVERKTSLTKAYSGRPARGINVLFMEKMQNQLVLPFPIQNTVTNAMRAAAKARGDAEYQSLWAGINFSLARSESTAELMARLALELNLE